MRGLTSNSRQGARSFAHMEPTERLATALRETLTEIVLIINETKARTVEVRNTPMSVPTVEARLSREVEGTAPPEFLLYPLDEARERLGGISRTTLYSLLGRGDLLAVKIGSRSFIPAESLKGFVEHLTQTADNR